AEEDEADGRDDGPARPAQGDQVAEEQAQGDQGRVASAWSSGRVPRWDAAVAAGPRSERAGPERRVQAAQAGLREADQAGSAAGPLISWPVSDLVAWPTARRQRATERPFGGVAREIDRRRL